MRRRALPILFITFNHDVVGPVRSYSKWTGADRDRRLCHSIGVRQGDTCFKICEQRRIDRERFGKLYLQFVVSLDRNAGKFAVIALGKLTCATDRRETWR